MSTTRARLLEETRQAFSRHAEMRGRIADEIDRAPETGDVFLSEAPGELLVEWVVLAREEDGRLVVVPGDANTLAGSGDVAVPAADPLGPLTLRCALACRVEPSRLDPASRVGVVEPVYVEQARQRWLAIEDGTFAGSVLAREVDDSPEYRRWTRSVVVPARDDLLAGVVSLAEHRARRDPGSFPRWLAAASIAVAVLGGTVVFQQWRWIEGRKDAVVSNQVVEVLSPGQQARGERREVVVPGRASHVSVFLPLEDGAAWPTYRLELVETATGAKTWTSEDLVREEPGEVRAGIPSSRMSTGDYELRLLGWEDGRYRLVREHALRIRKQ